MLQLTKAATAWRQNGFNTILKEEIEQVDASQLPLQAGLSQSSYVSDEPFRVMVIGSTDTDNCIRVHIGVFYTGIIAGCNCADDPTPVDTQTEYCEMLVEIDRQSGEAVVTLAED